MTLLNVVMASVYQGVSLVECKRMVRTGGEGSEHAS